MNIIKKLYSAGFVLIFWQPVVWNKLKPKDGVIDNRSSWFHRHAVNMLNASRNNHEGWTLFYIFSTFGLRVRDPHAHISKLAFKWSSKHLFVLNRKVGG